MRLQPHSLELHISSLVAFVDGGCKADEGCFTGTNASIGGQSAAWSTASQWGDANQSSVDHSVDAPAGSIEMVNSADVSLSSYEDTVAMLVAWSKRTLKSRLKDPGTTDSLTLTFRAPATLSGDLVKYARGGNIGGVIARGLSRSTTRRFLLANGTLQYFKVRIKRRKKKDGGPVEEFQLKGSLDLRHAACSVVGGGAGLQAEELEAGSIDRAMPQQPQAQQDQQVPQAQHAQQRQEEGVGGSGPPERPPRQPEPGQPEQLSFQIHGPNEHVALHAPSLAALRGWTRALREAIGTANGGTTHLARALRQLRVEMRSKQRMVLCAAQELEWADDGDVPDGMMPDDARTLRRHAARQQAARGALARAKQELARAEKVLQFWARESLMELHLEEPGFALPAFARAAAAEGSADTARQTVSQRQRAQTLKETLM
eukprot:g3563.t1